MTSVEAVRGACASIQRRRAGGRLTVGIDGGGGAGKSTLARGVRDAYEGMVVVVACDDFYRPLHGSQFSPEAAYENYFDWRRLRDEVLAPLRRGNPARYQRQDWSTDSLAEWIEIEPREIVIVEGVFSTRPELRPLIDIAILVDTPRDERLRRMLERPQDGTSWMDQWMTAEDWYFRNIAPRWYADLIVEGF
jgi:uridine kinase